MFKNLKEKFKKMKVSFKNRWIHRKFCKLGMEEAITRTPEEFFDFIVTEWNYSTDIANNDIMEKKERNTKLRGKKCELVLLYVNFINAYEMASKTHKKYYFKEAIKIYKEIKKLKELIKK